MITEQTFTSYKDISNHFGMTNGVHLLDDDRDLPYILVDYVYYYFGHNGDGYRLIMTSSKDIGE